MSNSHFSYETQISPATVSYIANELIQIAVAGESNPDFKYVNNVDWYINPNLNPGIICKTNV